MSKKLGESAKVTAGIVPGVFAAGDLTPLIIDRFGFEDAIVHIKVGAATGTPTAQSVSLKLQPERLGKVHRRFTPQHTVSDSLFTERWRLRMTHSEQALRGSSWSSAPPSSAGVCLTH